MSGENEAIELLNKIRDSGFQNFFENCNMAEKGIYFILGYLEQNEGKEIIAGDLSKKLNVSTARIAALLKKMEKRELIKRKSLESDARKTVVVLTKKGKSVYETNYANAVKVMAKLIEKVGLEKMEKLIQISNKINEVLKEESAFFNNINVNC